jgi:hypothetical protein
MNASLVAAIVIFMRLRWHKNGTSSVPNYAIYR